MQRLFKSEKDKVFDGVCGGIGEYLGIDPVIVRLLWILLVIFGGTGVVAYLVAMLIIPKRPLEGETEIHDSQAVVPANVSKRFWGILLMVAGLFLLLGLIGPLSGLFAGVTIFMGHALWPVLVIGLGLYLFMNQNEKPDVKSALNDVFPEGKKLQRSLTDRKLVGVCGGIAAYFSVDSNIIRIFWVMATLGSFGLGVLAYIVLAIFLTESE
jgi:phage shock protein C